MRPHIRKKVQMQEIENVQFVHSLCRLCLGRTEEMTSIFDANVDGGRSGLARRIVMCLGLKVSQDDALPKRICKLCKNDLEKFYAFKNNCAVTYRKLKTVLATRKVDVKKGHDESIEKEVKSLSALDNEEKATDNNVLYKLTQNEASVEPATCKSPLTQENILDVKNGTLATGILKGKVCYEQVGFLGPHTTVTPDVEIGQALVANNQLDKVEYLVNVAQAKNNEQNEKPGNTKTSECLPAYIVNSLIEGGVLAKRDDKLEVLDHDNKTFYLETAYGSEVVLELVEEESEEISDASSKKSESNTINANWKSDARCCGTCGARFSSRGSLLRHARVHSGERPHACRTCGRRFSQREVLRRHELLHADKLPFACAQCPKAYTQRSALLAHARSHGAAPALLLHRCCRCPKVFLHRSGLSRHQTVHEGKAYPCDECARTFNDQSSLQRHRRGHQPIRDT